MFTTRLRYAAEMWQKGWDACSSSQNCTPYEREVFVTAMRVARRLENLVPKGATADEANELVRANYWRVLEGLYEDRLTEIEEVQIPKVGWLLERLWVFGEAVPPYLHKERSVRWVSRDAVR